MISGAGAAGVAVARILLAAGSGHRRPRPPGRAHSARDDLTPVKQALAVDTADHFGRTGAPRRRARRRRRLHRRLRRHRPRGVRRRDGADAIIFGLANPNPEVHPDVAHRYARVVATGRSDFPNQINNVLAFPGIFRGALDVQATAITEGMKLAAANALADLVGDDLRRGPDHPVARSTRGSGRPWPRPSPRRRAATGSPAAYASRRSTTPGSVAPSGSSPHEGRRSPAPRRASSRVARTPEASRREGGAARRHLRSTGAGGPGSARRQSPPRCCRRRGRRAECEQARTRSVREELPAGAAFLGASVVVVDARAAAGALAGTARNAPIRSPLALDSPLRMPGSPGWTGLTGGPWADARDQRQRRTGVSPMGCSRTTSSWRSARERSGSVRPYASSSAGIAGQPGLGRVLSSQLGLARLSRTACRARGEGERAAGDLAGRSATRTTPRPAAPVARPTESWPTRSVDAGSAGRRRWPDSAGCRSPEPAADANVPALADPAHSPATGPRRGTTRLRRLTRRSRSRVDRTSGCELLA